MDLMTAYRRTLRRRATKRTRKLIKEAIQTGKTGQLTHYAYGPEEQAAWMDIGWSPDTESPCEGGYTKMTLRLDIPDMPW